MNAADMRTEIKRVLRSHSAMRRMAVFATGKINISEMTKCELRTLMETAIKYPIRNFWALADVHAAFAEEYQAKRR